ncbi:MAG: hypothetical protein WCT04_12630 [Planctomycetota bacterium]
MKHVLILALVLLLSVSLCFAGGSGDPVQIELGELAKKIAASLKDDKSVRIGTFVGRGDIHSYFGPEINRVLAKELAALGIHIDAKAKSEVNGEYRPATVAPEDKQPDFKLTCIRLNVKIVDANTGDLINGIVFEPRSIFGESAVLRAIAVPVSIPPTASTKKADEIIRESYQKPSFNLTNSTIKSSDKSPFAVEVLVVGDKDAANPERGADVLRTAQGLPFIHVQKGQYYRLRIHNNADHEVAVRVSIDGIDQYSFSDPEFRKPDGTPRFNYRILSPHTSEVIKGWYRNPGSFDYFVVTDYAKSAAAELKRGENDVGQIALEFRACWEKDSDRPADEGKNSRSPVATGREHGGRETTVEVVRNFGVMRDVIGIRYGSQLPQ